jgi:hypothetical protein
MGSTVERLCVKEPKKQFLQLILEDTRNNCPKNLAALLYLTIMSQIVVYAPAERAETMRHSPCFLSSLLST